MNYNPNSVREDSDHLYINNLGHPSINQTVFLMRKLIHEKGYQEIFLCLESDMGYVFCDRLVQLAGVMDYFQTREKITITINGYDNQTYLKQTFFQEPRLISENSSWLKGEPLKVVWKFTSANDVHLFVDSMIEKISSKQEVQKGFLRALEWSLNEVLENVLNHSDAGYGMVLSDMLERKNEIDIAVFDDGKGIFNSLLYSPHRPTNTTDAIYLAMQENVTRNKNIGQGNGLYGLYELIKQNKGRLSIASSNALVIVEEEGEPSNYNISTIDMKEHACTRVSYNLILNNEADIGKVMGYQTVDFRLEQFEDGNNDSLLFLVTEHANGYGSRVSGEEMRNHVINLVNDTKKPINIDFMGVRMVSSSFADEFIGKLAVRFGFIGFSRIFTLANMDETITQIVEKSVTKRLAVGLDDEENN